MGEGDGDGNSASISPCELFLLRLLRDGIGGGCAYGGWVRTSPASGPAGLDRKLGLGLGLECRELRMSGIELIECVEPRMSECEI
jgi:hypothetical protein